MLARIRARLAEAHLSETVSGVPLFVDVSEVLIEHDEAFVLIAGLNERFDAHLPLRLRLNLDNTGLAVNLRHARYAWLLASVVANQLASCAGRRVAVNNAKIARYPPVCVSRSLA